MGSEPHKQGVNDGCLRLLSNMYGLVLILFGVMFPVSEALQDYWHESHYNGVFLVYIFVVATVFLLYLQIYIIPASHRLHEAIEKRKHEVKTQTLSADSCITSNVVLTNPKKLDMQSLKSFDTEIMPAITKSNSYRHPSMSTSVNNNNWILNASSLSRESNVEESADTEHVWIGLDSIKDLFAHDGSSFYLRLGALLFGIGNLIYIGLELSYLYSPEIPAVCNEALYSWTYILHLIFVLVQTFFLFKNGEISIITQENLTRFGFKHLIATNISVWIRTLIDEILLHSNHVSVHTHETPSHYGSPLAFDQELANGTTCEEHQEFLINASPYLFPFVLEYSLIATGIFAIMCSEIGHDTGIDVMRNLKHLLHSHSKNISAGNSDEEDSQSLQNYAGPLHTHSGRIDLSSSHKGMFLGFLCLAGALVAITLFFNYIANGEDESAQLCYLVTDISLEVCLIVATVMCLCSLNKLSTNSKPLGVDDILLLIAMSGSFLYEISVMISTSFCLAHDSTTQTGSETDGCEPEYLIILSLTSSVLATIQVVLQTILIISGLRRYSSNMQQELTKPGREALTFLVVTNVTMWIFGTAQIKNTEFGIQEQFYGQLAWLFILNLNLPLYLFFRFHSSVCLADIWHIAYQSVTPELTFTKTPEPLPILAKSRSRQSSQTSGLANPVFQEEHFELKSSTQTDQDVPQSTVKL